MTFCRACTSERREEQARNSEALEEARCPPSKHELVDFFLVYTCRLKQCALADHGGPTCAWPPRSLRSWPKQKRPGSRRTSWQPRPRSRRPRPRRPGQRPRPRRRRPPLPARVPPRKRRCRRRPRPRRPGQQRPRRPGQQRPRPRRRRPARMPLRERRCRRSTHLLSMLLGIRKRQRRPPPFQSSPSGRAKEARMKTNHVPTRPTLTHGRDTTVVHSGVPRQHLVAQRLLEPDVDGLRPHMKPHALCQLKIRDLFLLGKKIAAKGGRRRFRRRSDFACSAARRGRR